MFPGTKVMIYKPKGSCSVVGFGTESQSADVQGVILLPVILISFHGYKPHNLYFCDAGTEETSPPNNQSGCRRPRIVIIETLGCHSFCV